MNKFIDQANLIKNDIIEFRRTIHRNPEVGDKLPKTKAYVIDKLKEFGYEPKEICESGIVATIKGNKPGKTFLLRADMLAYFPDRMLSAFLASGNIRKSKGPSEPMTKEEAKVRDEEIAACYKSTNASF